MKHNTVIKMISKPNYVTFHYN